MDWRRAIVLFYLRWLMLPAWCVFCDGYHLNHAGYNCLWTFYSPDGWYRIIMSLWAVSDTQVVIRWLGECHWCDQGLGMWPRVITPLPPLILSSYAVTIFSSIKESWFYILPSDRVEVCRNHCEVEVRTTHTGSCYNSGWDVWCIDVSPCPLHCHHQPPQWSDAIMRN